MKTATKVQYLSGKNRASRQLRRTLHHLDNPNCRHPSNDAFIIAGDHLQKYVPASQNLDNPPVEKPRFVMRTDGKVVKYEGP